MNLLLDQAQRPITHTDNVSRPTTGREFWCRTVTYLAMTAESYWSGTVDMPTSRTHL